MPSERSFDVGLAARVLTVLYPALAVLAAMVAASVGGAQLAVLTLLSAMVLGFVLAGLTALLTMTLLDLRRAALTS